MDMAAMLVKDLERPLRMITQISKRLGKTRVISKKDSELLREYNGLRNAIVHKYDWIS